MKTVGIICEYNPLHLGHQKQIDRIRQEFGDDTVIICAMSGNFVQRGSPAIIDKSIRAQAAVMCGADLVLELPVTVALSSAEGFAAGGVSLLAVYGFYLTRHPAWFTLYLVLLAVPLLLDILLPQANLQ